MKSKPEEEKQLVDPLLVMKGSKPEEEKQLVDPLLVMKGSL